MTEFLDKGAVLEALEYLVSEIKNGEYASEADRKKGEALAQASTKELIAELKVRPGVQVKEFLDLREGDTWRISGDVPTIVISVADFWRDRS